eukprot:16319910-Heterocapsa_arctica.AAC.1
MKCHECESDQHLVRERPQGRGQKGAYMTNVNPTPANYLMGPLVGVISQPHFYNKFPQNYHDCGAQDYHDQVDFDFTRDSGNDESRPGDNLKGNDPGQSSGSDGLPA